MLNNIDMDQVTPAIMSNIYSDIDRLDPESLLCVLPAPTGESETAMRQALLIASRRALKLHAEFARSFPPPLFGNANWLILLGCLAALLGSRLQCVKQIRGMIDESGTAVLRRIEVLEKKGLVGRKRDPNDGRRTHVLLTVRGYRMMANHLPRLFQEPSGEAGTARH